jgi:hypothetical protein
LHDVSVALKELGRQQQSDREFRFNLRPVFQDRGLVTGDEGCADDGG